MSEKIEKGWRYSTEHLRWMDLMVRKVTDLEKVHMGRFFKPQNFGEVTKCSLHHFFDTCDSVCCQPSYICLVDDSGRIHYSLTNGKAHVAPLKYITIPWI